MAQVKATTTKTATAAKGSKAKAKTPAKGKAKAAPKTKAADKAKADPKPTAITILDKDFAYGGDGTARRRSWDALATQKGTKTVAKYKENGGKVKYLRRWADAGKIKLAA